MSDGAAGEVTRSSPGVPGAITTGPARKFLAAAGSFARSARDSDGAQAISATRRALEESFARTRRGDAPRRGSLDKTHALVLDLRRPAVDEDEPGGARALASSDEVLADELGTIGSVVQRDLQRKATLVVGVHRR